MLPDKFYFEVPSSSTPAKKYLATKSITGYHCSYEEGSMYYPISMVERFIDLGAWVVLDEVAEVVDTLLSTIQAFVTEVESAEVVITKDGYDVYLPFTSSDSIKIANSKSLEEFMAAARVVWKYL